jgi:transposase
MRKILEILRLKFEHGLSGRAIALSVCAALSTVQECLRRFVASGLGWPLPSDMDEATLEARLYPTPEVSAVSEPDWNAVLKRLSSFKGMTRQQVWREYREQHPDGLRYSAFCAGLARFVGEQKLSARQVHAPGSVMFVDYAGPPLFVTDRRSGVRQPVRVFVAALGHSGAVHATATPGETTRDWLEGHVRALGYFGGVPLKIVPDNARAVISRSCRYEPEVNPAYTALAQHYGCAVVPARVRKPKDKAKVENAVQIVERQLFPALLERSFFGLEQLNAALWAGIDVLNGQPFQKREGSRMSALIEERLALKPLPVQAYEHAQWKRAKVPLDYHIEVDQGFYSVPHVLAGKTVEVRSSAATIEVFMRGKRVASHLRLHRRGEWRTVPEHRPERHRPVGIEQLYQRAELIGPSCATLARRQSERRRHPDETQRTVQGLLRLARDYGENALESACARALALGTLSYRAVLELLKHPQPAQHAPAQAIVHTHLRGADYYASTVAPNGEPPCSSIH